MSDIFREVDEALQKEKAEKLWKEYGPILILAAVTLVLSTAAVTAYRSWDAWRSQQETQKLLQAMTSENMPAALADIAGDTRDAQDAIARMTAAAAHGEKKEFEQAASLYGEIANDKGAPDVFRDLAAILQTRSLLMADPAKASDKQLLENLLPIAKNDDAAFQLQAKMDAALLYGEGQQDYASALSLLEGLEDADISASLKEKAMALKHVYEYEQSRTAEQKDTPRS